METRLKKNELCSAYVSHHMWLNIIGKVQLKGVGQQSSPTPAGDPRGGPWGIAGLLVCSFASVELHCSFAS